MDYWFAYTIGFLVMYGAILQEVRYLTKKFGEEYLKYKSSVRRWL